MADSIQCLYMKSWLIGSQIIQKKAIVLADSVTVTEAIIIIFKVFGVFFFFFLM